ncbi:MAG TPA: TonB-dependent receptor [Bacteroidales bacterium]
MKSKNYVHKRTYAFTQWTRKPYAVFNSLRLTIKISVMCVAYTLLNPVQETKAQSDSTQIKTQHELDEVEVAGQRAPVVHSQMARVVSVITRSEVERAPFISVDDILRQVPQVDVRTRGANGAQADISIQGGSFDETLILLNGINLTDPQTGHYNLTLPFDIESVDRIEVLKGPASRVYGTNAFSGAVNFVTGQETDNHIKASLLGGDFDLYRGAITANVHSAHATNFISVSKGKSDGYVHNTDYDYTNAYYLGKAIFSQNNNVTFQFGYGDNAYGANSFYSPYSADQFDHTKTYFTSLGGELGNNIKIKPYVYWRRNYDHYVWIRSNPSVYENFHLTDVYGGGLNTVYQTTIGKTALGIDYRKEHIYSTVLGKPLIPWKEVSGDTSHYKYSDARENISVFLEHSATIRNFYFSAGVMGNHNTKLAGIGFYPGVDVSYQLPWNHKVYVTVNKSLRLPTFTDLYYNGPQNVGNPNLKPEQAWSFETGLKFAKQGISGNFSYFHRWGTDIIDWIWNNIDSKWHTVNYTKLNTDGLEIAGQFNPREIYSANFPIENIVLSYSYTTLSKNSGNEISNYALDHLRHKLAIGISHRIYKTLGASWQFAYQKRNGNYGKYDATSNTMTDTPYKAFALLDGKVFYDLHMLKIYAEATNILNSNYVDLGNIAQPGRWFKMGVEVNVGWK